MKEEPILVQVWVCQGLDLANIRKSLLEAAGIPVLLQYDSAGPVFGITVDGLGQVRMLVPEEFAGEATELLKGADEAQWAEDAETSADVAFANGASSPDDASSPDEGALDWDTGL